MFSLRDTLSSGQCFRFSEENGLWTVKSGIDEQVKVLTVSQNDLSPITDDEYWSEFFDINTDYEAMKSVFSEISPIMKQACEFAPGIRILNQNSWEALCSFVISQNNNIKRIMGIVERLSTSFGKQNSLGIHGFPSPETLVGLRDEELRETGLGFRVQYVKNTARAVLDGKINLNYLKTSDIDEARKMLMSVKGIGPKVADCALLFGCHRLDCFPVDVWMKKVMNEFFKGQSPAVFGQYAGVAQQYLFHWARTSGIFSK